MGTLAFSKFYIALIISTVAGKVQHVLYVLYLCYAVAAVVAVVSAVQIYIKINMGEEGVIRSIVSLFWACMFIIAASVVFPAFFGYRI